MKILAIDTASKACSVSLVDNNQIIQEHISQEEKTHSSTEDYQINSETSSIEPDTSSIHLEHQSMPSETHQQTNTPSFEIPTEDKLSFNQGAFDESDFDFNYSDYDYDESYDDDY